MNRTELRHRTLAAVKAEPDQFAVQRDFSDRKPIYKGPGELSGSQKRALRELDLNNLLCRGAGARPWSMFVSRPLRLSDSGKRLLAEWDEKYGPVTP